MRSDRELEELIDAALPGYSEAEPRPGFEQRVIVRSLAARPRRFEWRWALALPAVACLLVVLFLTTRRNPARPGLVARTGNSTTVARPVSDVAKRLASSSLIQKRHQSRPRLAETAAIGESLPKQEVFPTPAPPTAEERRLMAFSRQQARLPLQSDAKEVEIPSIHIAELQIKPLSVSADDPLGPSAMQSAPKDQQP